MKIKRNINIIYMDKLLPHQTNHVENLIICIKENNRALDLSDTGMGKTYTSIALAIKLNLKLFVVCPKSVINNWYMIIKEFNFSVNNFIVCSYSMLHKHPFQIANWEIQDIEDYLFVFDECHICKNIKTKCAQMLLSLSKTQSNILLLSATIIDKTHYFMFKCNLRP